MSHYLAVAQVDQQADAVPASSDAHVGQVAARVGARRAAAEAPRHRVRHVGPVGHVAMTLEPFAPVRADQAVFPHYPADAPATGGYAGPRQRRLYLARAVAAMAGLVRCDHVALDGVGRFRAFGAEVHRVVGGARNAKDLALRRYRVAVGVRRYHRHFRANISAACFKTSTSM